MVKWLREEFRQILPVWIFFFLSFGLLSITRAVILGEYQIRPEQPPEYLGGSLIMAKVVVLLDAFLKNTRLRNLRLIYFTIWNTFLYCAAALLVYYFEQTLKMMRHEHLEFAQAGRHVSHAMREPWFLVIMTWLIVLTFTFCMIREMIASVGLERVRHMFLAQPAQSSAEEGHDRRAA